MNQPTKPGYYWVKDYGIVTVVKVFVIGADNSLFFIRYGSSDYMPVSYIKEWIGPCGMPIKDEKTSEPVKRYCIVQAPHPEMVEEFVSKRIKEGWKVQGGISHTFDQKTGYFTYTQAMTKQ